MQETNSKPSRALDFFLQVKSGGIQFLKGLVSSTPPTFETDWLDFKGGAKLTDDNTKRIWSKALSGFANTEGGVLVWGIDARKDATTGIDCAAALSLVNTPAAFVSRLKELQSQSNDPPVAGVDYWHADDDGTKNAGFVVCLVPESKFKPHRAELADRNYYIRAGDSFHIPSVSLLKNLFFPEYHSHLWPELKTSFDTGTVQVEGFLHNSGIATAKNVVVFVVHNAQTPWKLDPATNNWHVIDTLHPEHLRGTGLTSPFLPIHPGTTSACFRLSRPIQPQPCVLNPIEFEIFMYCENNLPLVSKVSFTKNELADKITKQGMSEIMEIERRGF